MTAQTLIGNFKGKDETEKILPVLIVAILHSIPIALTFASVSFWFPEIVFGLLTNSSEISASINSYTPWLFPLLVSTAIAVMLEGYLSVSNKEDKYEILF